MAIVSPWRDDAATNQQVYIPAHGQDIKDNLFRIFVLRYLMKIENIIFFGLI